MFPRLQPNARCLWSKQIRRTLQSTQFSLDRAVTRMAVNPQLASWVAVWLKACRPCGPWCSPLCFLTGSEQSRYRLGQTSEIASLAVLQSHAGHSVMHRMQLL